MLIVKDENDYNEAVDFLQQGDLFAYDTETTGLNVRKDRVIGFGASNALDGFYVPIWQYNGTELVRCGISDTLINSLLGILQKKRLICWNTSFDAMITKNNLGINMLQAIYCDAMLLKHSVDEEFPFGLKDVGAQIFGTDAKAEQLELKAHMGTTKDFYKVPTEVLARYCIKDCLLTYRLYQHYSKELGR